MNCKNCGAQLDLDTKFCPNCGSQNIQAVKHINDMERYGRKFDITRKQVVKNSKRFVKYITPLTTLAIAVIICAMSYAFSGNMLDYHIAQRYRNSYNKKNEQEISKRMMVLIGDGDYQAAYQAYLKIEYNAGGYKDSSWYSFYNAAGAYIKLRESITADFDPAMAGTYNAEQAISRAAESIEALEYEIKKLDTAYAKPAEESVVYMKRLQNEMHIFLKAYCNFTKEDIKDISEMDRKSIISLLVRRMDDENGQKDK